MRIFAIAAILGCSGMLGGCVWGIERGGPESVVVNHYFQAMEEASEDAGRWCGRFGKRAEVRATERMDTPSFYYRTTFRCVAP